MPIKIEFFWYYQNILINSIRFTKIGTITINVKRTYNRVFVKIGDSGIGTDKDILPRLFDKFITGSSSGTGLGLYICKNIIEAHGGSIWIKNNDQNKGATFIFALPIDIRKWYDHNAVNYSISNDSHINNYLMRIYIR